MPRPIPTLALVAIIAVCMALPSIMPHSADAGRLMVVLLIAISVVASPIPGGPVALAAGAAFGAVEGGALTLAGAFLGAMAAFLLSRHLGRTMLIAASGKVAAWVNRPYSQNLLMALVFASRLVPFVSFDAISYAAGLSRLATWRFAAATFFGIAPTSFALAAAGAGANGIGLSPSAMLVACGLTVILPGIALGIGKIRKAQFAKF